jgi:glutaryl-CoA dehydrogenase
MNVTTRFGVAKGRLSSPFNTVRHFASTRSASKFSKFDWEDPLNLKCRLTEEERSVMESTRTYCHEKLMPRVLKAHRDESTL